MLISTVQCSSLAAIKLLSRIPDLKRLKDYLIFIDKALINLLLFMFLTLFSLVHLTNLRLLFVYFHAKVIQQTKRLPILF